MQRPWSRGELGVWENLNERLYGLNPEADGEGPQSRKDSGLRAMEAIEKFYAGEWQDHMCVLRSLEL